MTTGIEQDTAAIQQAMAEFIRAFTHLDWDAFRRCWADDATLFRPEGVTGRTQGSDAITERFRSEFERRRADRPAPPFFDLVPEELLIQPLGGAAVYSFVLPRATHTSRRSFVLHQTPNGWKIVHLHASDRALP